MVNAKTVHGWIQCPPSSSPDAVLQLVASMQMARQWVVGRCTCTPDKGRGDGGPPLTLCAPSPPPSFLPSRCAAEVSWQLQHQHTTPPAARAICNLTSVTAWRQPALALQQSLPGLVAVASLSQPCLPPSHVRGCRGAGQERGCVGWAASMRTAKLQRPAQHTAELPGRTQGGCAGAAEAYVPGCTRLFGWPWPSPAF